MDKFYTIKSIEKNLKKLWLELIALPENAWLQEWFDKNIKKTALFYAKNELDEINNGVVQSPNLTKLRVDAEAKLKRIQNLKMQDISGYEAFRQVFLSTKFGPILLKIKNWKSIPLDQAKKPFDGKEGLSDKTLSICNEAWYLLLLWAEIKEAQRVILSSLKNGFDILSKSFTKDTYVSYLEKLNHISELLDIQHFDNDTRKETRQEFEKLFGNFYSKPFDKNDGEKVAKYLANLVEFNPFFVWNLLFIWLKHPEYRREINASLKTFTLNIDDYCLFLLYEILTRCLYDKIKDFDKIKKILEYFLDVLRDWYSKFYVLFNEKLNSYFGPNFEEFSKLDAPKQTDIYSNCKKFLVYLFNLLNTNYHNVFIVYSDSYKTALNRNCGNIYDNSYSLYYSFLENEDESLLKIPGWGEF